MHRGYVVPSGGAQAATMQIPSALLTAASADPNGLFTGREARNMGDGWIEVDYNDGVFASDHPNSGIQFDLGEVPSVAGGTYASINPSYDYMVSIEIDAAYRNPYQMVSLLASSVAPPISTGSHQGVCAHLDVSGKLWGRLVRGGVFEAGTATGHSDGVKVLYRWMGAAAAGTLQGRDVRVLDASGSRLVAVPNVGSNAALSTLDRLTLTVHTKSAAGSGTKTARFRVRVLCASVEDAIALGL